MMHDFENEWFSQEDESREDELGALLGDPRRCPHHPHMVTSSPDGMFDCPCGECEYEMSKAAREEEYNRVGGYSPSLFDAPICLSSVEFAAEKARLEAEAEIPF